MKPLSLGPAVLAILGIGVLACGDDSTQPGNQNQANVSVVDNAFQPSAANVAAGGTVRWTWNGSASHNVTFDDASVGNSATQTNGTFERTFADAGDFTYYCTIHGRAMSGTVRVGS